MLSSITATLKTSKFLPTDVECSQRRRPGGSTGAAQSNFVSFLEYHVRGPVIPNVGRLRAVIDQCQRFLEHLTYSCATMLKVGQALLLILN